MISAVSNLSEFKFDLIMLSAIFFLMISQEFTFNINLNNIVWVLLS